VSAEVQITDKGAHADTACIRLGTQRIALIWL
jgi:hypothetical protein